MVDKTFNRANSTKAIGGIFAAKVLPIAISILNWWLEPSRYYGTIGYWFEVKDTDKNRKVFIFEHEVGLEWVLTILDTMRKHLVVFK